MHTLLLASLLPVVLGAAYRRAGAAAPTVTLDSAVFTGANTDGTVDEFLGIRFAQSTTGNNRFNLPMPVPPYTGNQDAAAFGAMCPQQAISPIPLPAGFPPATGGSVTSEDCLFVNVFKPTTAQKGSNLPVLVWIYGGGFEIGDASAYPGTGIVSRSIAINEPVIFVSMNYRLAAWGFLASKEVKAAGVGNLGLQDQRLALQWVQKYIANFGGDPTKVMLWGESAGAISVAMQMVTNGGNTQGLFRSAFMQSGAPLPVGDITHGQKFYDMLVSSTGCSGAPDTLQCMRGVSEDTLQNAVNLTPSFSSFSSLNEAWMPRVDGKFLTDDPQKLVLRKSVANIPFINGNNDDEGTIFSLQLNNITTDAEFTAYVHSNYFSAAPQSVANNISKLYPSDVTAGSPFDTGTANAITPEYKRLAAFQGDLLFQGPRRLFIDTLASRQPIWSYLNKRLKNTENAGSYHASDLQQTILGHAELQDYLINFATNLDPNKGTSADPLLSWPRFSTSSQQLLTILDGATPLEITKDNFRTVPIAYLISVGLAYPL